MAVFFLAGCWPSTLLWKCVPLGNPGFSSLWEEIDGISRCDSHSYLCRWGSTDAHNRSVCDSFSSSDRLENSLPLSVVMLRNTRLKQPRNIPSFSTFWRLLLQRYFPCWAVFWWGIACLCAQPESAVLRPLSEIQYKVLHSQCPKSWRSSTEGWRSSILRPNFFLRSRTASWRFFAWRARAGQYSWFS